MHFTVRPFFVDNSRFVRLELFPSGGYSRQSIQARPESVGKRSATRQGLLRRALLQNRERLEPTSEWYVDGYTSARTSDVRPYSAFYLDRKENSDTSMV
jgi:hypothetical protein